MHEFVFKPAPLPFLPIKGESEKFPVHRIYCVGQNYADHVIEMGGDPSRNPPFFFQKNPDNLVLEGEDFPYPSRTEDVHHEVELVVALAKGGSDIAVAQALDCVFGYAVGVDMTRRDLQAIAKKAGRPWEVAKAFEHSAPCSALVRRAVCGDPQSGEINLSINGEIRQSGDLGQMIWKVSETIAYLSSLFALKPGDLIFTGTPAGVGPVHPGDHIVGQIEGVGELSLQVI